MKIAWYTPFSADSEIGRFSRLAIKALRGAGTDVQVVRSETRTASIRGSDVVSADESYIWAASIHRDTKAQLDQYDLVVYNVGNDYPYHTYCFEHQSIVPGLTILHDYCLHHALNYRCVHDMMQRSHYGEHLAAECGSDAARIYNRLVNSGSPQLWWHHEIARFPIYRWAMQDTLGVITHAEFYRETVAQRIGCPVISLPLAHETRPTSGDEASLDDEAVAHRNQLTVLTYGPAATNVRYEAVIRALAESETLLERCRYRIVGSANTVQKQTIDLAIQAHSNRPDLTLTGPVSRDVLRQEIDAADVISCLRYPALEGASASVIEGLLSGKPVMVCDTGSYAEIPDELVFKVSPNHEHSDVTGALESILADYPGAVRRARAARSWAAQRHSPAAYAAGLIKFAEQVLYDRPVLNVADRVAACLQHWNTQPDACLLNRVDHAMYDLFRPKQKRRAAA